MKRWLPPLRINKVKVKVKGVCCVPGLTMEDKLGISKAGFVRNNFLQNDMMTLQISTGKVGERLGVLGK